MEEGRRKMEEGRGKREEKKKSICFRAKRLFQQIQLKT